MGSFAFVYVSHGELEEVISRVRLSLKQAVVVRRATNSSWIQVDLDNQFEQVQSLAQELSFRLKEETIGLLGQTVSDAYGIWSFRAGTPFRTLVYGMDEEAVWEEVAGKPLSAEDLIFGDNQPQVGSREPMLTSYDVFDLGKAIGLPGFLDCSWCEEVKTDGS